MRCITKITLFGVIFFDFNTYKCDMKLKLKRALIILCLSLLMCISGCNTNRIYNMAIRNIAEVRVDLWENKTDNMSTTFISGYREEDYVVNGYCTDMIEFGVLTFDVNPSIVLPDVVNYVLTIDSTRYDGVLEHNPYNDTYVCDITKCVNASSVVVAKIIAGDFVETVELHPQTTNWVLDYKEALKVACGELEEYLEKFVENEQFCGECYIKILNDDEVNSTYYWYINFVSRDGKNYAVVIDPNSSEIMAKKTI